MPLKREEFVSPEKDEISRIREENLRLK